MWKELTSQRRGRKGQGAGIQIWPGVWEHSRGLSHIISECMDLFGGLATVLSHPGFWSQLLHHFKSISKKKKNLDMVPSVHNHLFLGFVFLDRCSLCSCGCRPGWPQTKRTACLCPPKCWDKRHALPPPSTHFLNSYVATETQKLICLKLLTTLWSHKVLWYNQGGTYGFRQHLSLNPHTNM